MFFTKYTATLLAVAGIVSAAPHQPRVLQFDDVILPRADGGYDVMKDWEWSHIERRIQQREREVAEEAKRAALAGETSHLAARGGANIATPRDLEARCEESTEIQKLTDTTFTDWDVAMSPVIAATGGTASVMVSRGYSVANSLSVGVSAELTLIEDVFKTSLSITTTTTWTSTDTSTLTYGVPAGQYGVVVSNPYTRRITGNVLSGCTDSPTVTGFSSDSRTDQSFGSLAWVAGPIYMCNSSTYPIPYCVGTGTHI